MALTHDEVDKVGQCSLQDLKNGGGGETPSMSGGGGRGTETFSFVTGAVTKKLVKMTDALLN